MKFKCYYLNVANVITPRKRAGTAIAINDGMLIGNNGSKVTLEIQINGKKVMKRGLISSKILLV